MPPVLTPIVFCRRQVCMTSCNVEEGFTQPVHNQPVARWCLWQISICLAVSCACLLSCKQHGPVIVCAPVRMLGIVPTYQHQHSASGSGASSAGICGRINSNCGAGVSRARSQHNIFLAPATCCTRHRSTLHDSFTQTRKMVMHTGVGCLREGYCR